MDNPPFRKTGNAGRRYETLRRYIADTAGRNLPAGKTRRAVPFNHFAAVQNRRDDLCHPFQHGTSYFSNMFLFVHNLHMMMPVTEHAIDKSHRLTEHEAHQTREEHDRRKRQADQQTAQTVPTRFHYRSVYTFIHNYPLTSDKNKKTHPTSTPEEDAAIHPSFVQFHAVSSA